MSDEETEAREETHSPPRRVRPLDAALGLAVLAAVSYWMLMWAGEAAVHGRKTEMVPDLSGTSVAAALDRLSPLGLGLIQEGNEFDSSVPVGSILRQNPAPGAVVREGRIVRVVISQGGRTVLVPALIGLPLRNAEMLLRQNQLLLGEASSAYSLRQDKGTVLAQDPKAESGVERQSMVNVVISAGSPPEGILLMPDFRRKNVDTVYSWASHSDVRVLISSDPASLFSYGAVLSQNPEPDSVLAPGTTVSILVSGKLSSAEIQSSQVRTYHYEIPQMGTEVLVRIVMLDKYGEHELFSGMRPGGSKIDLPLDAAPGSRLKIFLNGILVQEKSL